MAERRYVDLKLWIGPPSTPDAVASVMLLPSPEIGEVLTPVFVSREREPGPQLLQGLHRKTLSPQQLIDLGERMADCFLPPGEIRECFLDAYKRVGQGGLRIRLLIADPALRTWPWEYVYLPRTAGPASSHGFLVLDPRVSLVRHEPLSHPHAAVEARDGFERDWRALLVGASPSSRNPLDVDHELDNILEALKDFEADGVGIECNPALRQATLEELNRATLKPGSAHLFHFAGHGVVAEAIDPYAASGMASTGYLLRCSWKSRTVRWWNSAGRSIQGDGRARGPFGPRLPGRADGEPRFRMVDRREHHAFGADRERECSSEGGQRWPRREGCGCSPG